MHTGVAMTITTLSSREFNQGASEAKRAANNGPVFITDRGKPAHVAWSKNQRNCPCGVLDEPATIQRKRPKRPVNTVNAPP